ncbi:MAG TPA: Trk system potassium transporter TrkA [Ruminococcus sp.]|nr:Trk system potassium transporter TrkA [Ruminococcus sp.]HCR72934.1 Trk system potassium transporter TrkA [Ruminococcus sp.]
MKVVIIGSGKVGSNISSSLSGEGHDVTVIDCKDAALAKIRDRQDIMCIEGDGADVDIQHEAEVGRAGLFIATTPHDELNILCCLIAKRLGAQRTISRVRNPVYFKQIDLIKEDLGLSMVMNPERIVSDEIIRLLVFPPAAKLEVFSKGRIELVEHKISANSVISGMSLAEIYKHNKIKFLICAVERDSQIFIPDGNFVLQSGDKINIAASHNNIKDFFRTIGSAANKKIRTVMIVGGGKICNYLVKQLLEMKIRVKIIENNYEKCCELAETFPKATIICSDGTEQEVLMEEGLDEVDAFIPMTGIDEENIIISLFAKNNSGAKIITKINRESYCDMASEMGVDCIVSPKSLASSAIVSYVRSLKNTADSNIEALYHIVGNKAEAIEFKIKSNIENLINIPLKDLKLKKNILICGIIRKREVIIPNGNDYMALGDSVVVISKDYHFSDIKDILE